MNSAQRGVWGEEQARLYLEKKGYHILTCNLQTHWGELDMVCLHKGILVVVEIRTRKPHHISQVDPNTLFSHTKQHHIRTTISHLLHSRHPLFEYVATGQYGLQVDLICILIGQHAYRIIHMKNILPEE